jgi:hypothetical protein
MVVLADLGSQYTKFHAAGVGRYDFLRPFPVIYSRLSGLVRFRDASDKGTASNFVQISGEYDEDLGNERSGKKV